MQQARKRSNQRDIIVVGCILVTFGIILVLTTPFVVLFLVHRITGYLHPSSYHLQWLTFSILPTALACSTPQAYALLGRICRRRNRHIQLGINLAQPELNQTNTTQ